MLIKYDNNIFVSIDKILLLCAFCYVTIIYYNTVISKAKNYIRDIIILSN